MGDIPGYRLRRAAVPDAGLNPFHQVGKEHVLCALDDKRHTAAGLLLQVLGVAVQFEVVGLHHRQHLGAGLLGHIRTVIQHTGYRTHRVSGQLCYVLDGQRNSPLVVCSGAYPLTAPAATPLMMYFWQDR